MRSCAAVPTSSRRTSRPWPSTCCGTGSCSRSRRRPKTWTRTASSERSSRPWACRDVRRQGCRSAETSPLRARRRLVTPEVLRQVKVIELRTRSLVSSLFTGEYRSMFRGQGIEFAEVREYQQGDDFRAIDWNVSARMGHPFVKTYHEERENTLLLVVDQSGSCQFGRPYTKAGLAVEVAAVLALAAARHNDRVGALMFADKVELIVRPAKGRPHALRVIRDLVAFT